MKILKFNLDLDDDENTKRVHKVADEFDKVLNDLNLLCNDPANFIFDYFSATRSKIRRKRQKLFDKVNNISDEMLKTLTILEDEAKENLTHLNSLLNQNQLELEKLEKLREHWNEELRKPNIEKERLNHLFDEIKKYLN